MRRLSRAAPAPGGGCLPDVARALARGTAAGLPLVDAFRRGADALAEPGGGAMRQCAAELAAGHPIGMALRGLAVFPGGRMLVGVIELHHELGGDLVASLNVLAEGLADRERLQLEARAATAQARIAARVVPMAPAASLLMLVAIAPGAGRALLGSAPGLLLLGVAGAMTALAVLLLRRIAGSAGL